MRHKVLVVDDEVDELTGWETVLRKAGYFVRTATTALTALELCDQFVFDLVILDYVMPKMKGLELLARIRDKNPLVRSILVSGRLGLPEQTVRETIRGEVESDKYLHKPVKNEQLLEAVSELLKKAQPSRPWEAIAGNHVAEKGTVSKARKVQGKLKKHITKGSN